MLIPDRILYNGRIHTLSKELPQVSALAIGGGRIVALGTDDDMRALARAGTVQENLGGRFVMPGLIDAHIHWELTARALQQVNLFEVADKATAVARVAARGAVVQAGAWITGYGWFQDIWPDRAFPTAADLDSVTPANPVYLSAKSAHAAWVNRAALIAAGIDAHTPDPPGGQIVRGADGQPTGLLLESAMRLVAERIPAPTTDQMAEQMLQAQRLAHASGLTGIHDFDDPSALRALQLLRERGELGLRVVKQINKPWLQAALDSGVRWGFGDDWIRVGALKLFADGALGPRTAHMIEPYESDPDNRGIVVTEKTEMLELASRASAAGLPTTIHAIGDQAVRDVLDVFEAVRQQEAARGEARASRRHRIEHVQIIHPADVHRLADLAVIASMQPLHATSDMLAADRYWGARSRWSYNARLQINQGARVAFGSDSPIEPFDPLKGIHAAVTRQRPDGAPGPDGWYPEARLTLDEALHGFTTGPAYAAGLEDCQGRLAPGFLADLIVLDRSLYDIPPSELLTAQVVGTMVDGEWRYGGV